jgi:hypothetical protein
MAVVALSDDIAGDGARDASAGGTPSILQRFWSSLTSRNGLLTIWAMLAFAALVGALVMHVFGPLEGLLDALAAKTTFVGAITLLVLPLLLLFLDPADNFQKGQRFTLPALSLGILIAITAFAIHDATLREGVMLGQAGSPLTTAQLAARASLFAFILVAFIPNIWNAVNFARFDAAQRQRIAKSTPHDTTSQTDDDAEAMGALLATTAVLLIAALAIWAGDFGSTLSFESLYGLILCAIVVSIFVIVVFLDLVSETPLVRFLGRFLHAVSKRMHFLAAFYNLIDTGLVRIGASVAGMRQDGMLKRYTLLAVTLTCLTLLAWYLPPPLGLIPAFMGFVLAMAVSRLWGWVEEDRALASMTEYKHDAPYRVGFREDFRDETLLGFAFVFGLVPIAMMQAHVGAFFGPHLFEDADNQSFLGWLGFFGVELAKAVPIVDWAEIYDVAPGRDLIQFKSAASRHAVFLARIMVDMVLIASLLQAIGITTRNRQQKSLFKARHVDRLDEFVERTELSRAIRNTRRADAGRITSDLKGAAAEAHFDLSKLGRDGVVDFRQYNQDRLFHLYGASKASLERRAFIAAIAHQGGFELLHAIELTQRISESNQNEPAMYAAFQRALEEHHLGQRPIDGDDVYLILSPLRNSAGLRDFKHLLIDSLVRFAPPEEVIDKLRGLAVGDKADGFKYTRNRIAEVIVEAAPIARDKDLLREAFADWQRWGRTPHRPNDNQYNLALKALQAAAKES